jgi:hypothetical protein
MTMIIVTIIVIIVIDEVLDLIGNSDFTEGW